MSTTSLPSYRPASSINGTPTYSFEPREQERRLAMGGRRVVHTGGLFSKQSRNRTTSLHLSARADSDTFPTYGAGSHLNGFVQVLKGDGVTGVEMKLEGSLKLREIAAGGHATVRLCLSTKTLWTKERENHMCPARLDFSLPFPEFFIHDEVNYPLPPTYAVKLSGLPGFTADIEYYASVVVNSDASGPVLKNKAIDLIAGTSNVTTPILYYPRTLPPSPQPSRLSTDAFGFIARNEWTCVESTITSKTRDLQDIKTKLYIPSSRTFPISEPVPFHLLLCSSAPSLAAFLPLSPALNTLGRPKAMRLQAMRQAAVDVKNVLSPSNRSAKREIWRIDSIGEANFNLTADAPSWIAYSGEIPLGENVKTPGFKAAGLVVKDCLLLTLNPPDLAKCPFSDLRQVVGIRLTTDGYGGSVGQPTTQS